MSVITMPRRKAKSEHYVNNKEFLAAIVEYKSRVKEAAAKEIPDLLDLPPEKQFEILKTFLTSPNKPRITNYLGECFRRLQHNFLQPNFVNYMFKDDMVRWYWELCSIHQLWSSSQVIHLHILLKLFTTHFSRIQREKRQLEIKTKFWAIGFEQVMVDDNTIDGGNYSDLSIKDNVHTNVAVIDEGCYYHRSTFRCRKNLKSFMIIF